MIVMAVIGGVIIIALGLAAWYDRRAKRLGGGGVLSQKRLSSTAWTSIP
jgi:hypothetical protein